MGKRLQEHSIRYRRKAPKRSLRAAFIFSSFFVLLTTGIVMSGIIYLISLYFPFEPNSIVPLTVIMLFSVVLGTFFFGMVSNVILRPVNEISEATKAVSKGDFSVRLDETEYIKEMQEIFKNFNLMVQELSTIETLREDFVVNISHEFKTPLAAIEGSAMLLQDENLSVKERKEFTDMILQTTKQLSSLTGNILRISKLESTEMPLQKVSFQLDEQIRQVILLLENKWVAKNIRIDIDLDEVTYVGNEELLFQVWENLLENAIKYSNENGKINISLYKTKDGCSVQIQDIGIGISESAQHHIFDKFYQENKKTQEIGNGLGLSLVQSIVEHHDGNILLKSEEDVGTVFTVRLPNAKTA